MKFRTLNSTYEIDFANNRVRRLEGANNPTPRQGPDGEWREYAEVYAVNPTPDTECMFFDWDGQGHGTITSPIQEDL